MELNTFKPLLVKPSTGRSFGWSCSTFPLLQLARQPLGTRLDHQPQLNAKIRTITAVREIVCDVKANLCYTAFNSTQGSNRLRSTARSVTLTSASVRVSFMTTAKEQWSWGPCETLLQFSCYSSCLLQLSLHYVGLRVFKPWFQAYQKSDRTATVATPTGNLFGWS